MDGMDIVLIKTVLEVAATGSFVKASERLFVSQSAVSLHVQPLEDTLGKQLFTRSKAGTEQVGSFVMHGLCCKVLTIDAGRVSA